MTEILLIRKIGKNKAGAVLEVELDGYWESHVEAGNAKILVDAPQEELLEEVDRLLADPPPLETVLDNEPRYYDGLYDHEIDEQDPED